ncbi:hypothetical protein SARC_15509, partial [Sphaeroforma arctica JP610]
MATAPKPATTTCFTAEVLSAQIAEQTQKIQALHIGHASEDDLKVEIDHLVTLTESLTQQQSEKPKQKSKGDGGKKMPKVPKGTRDQ